MASRIACWSRLLALSVLALVASAAAARAGDAGAAWDDWTDAIDRAVIDAYAPGTAATPMPPVPADVTSALRSGAATGLLTEAAAEATALQNPSAAAGVLRARGQQALVVEMDDAIRRGDLDRARLWRARLHKSRGTSSAEGALLLAALKPEQAQRDETARLLTREAITWQTTRARELMALGVASTKAPVPLPGRLTERFAEALALADLPAALRDAAGLTETGSIRFNDAARRLRADVARPWDATLTAAVIALQRDAESSLPSLLTDVERQRREKLILRLANLIPLEYQAGVRDGEISVALEYREAVNFTAQSRQMLGELAPLWLRGEKAETLRVPLARLEDAYAAVADLIDRKAPGGEVEAKYKEITGLLTDSFKISVKRSGGPTGEVVGEIMLEVRELLGKSLVAAKAGKWKEAEALRLDAYTTFDPDIEARLMPRDPTLAINIERMLLDGVDQPGIKTLLDRRDNGPELDAAYARVKEAMDRGAAMLQTTVDPTAAAINGASIVLREGLEGLLVIVAIFAGLRGAENARRRRLFWVGIVGSVAATAITWGLSLTLITSLNAYAEVIAAVTGIIAIGILLLITNWLFQQVYWKQWVTTLKGQAAGESTWQLISVGFLVGYREGFETVLFLQSLVMDAGGKPVSIGVGAGCLILLLLGIAALKIGLKLPYYKILLVTAVMIGVVLVTFVGGTVRASQTVGWLPVHRFTPGSWPNWTGNWLGLYNTWESVIAQVVTVVSVVGTWRVARWNSKRKTAKRRVEMQVTKATSAGAAVMARGTAH